MPLEVAEPFEVQAAESEVRTCLLLVRCVRDSEQGGGGVSEEGRPGLSDIRFHTQNRHWGSVAPRGLPPPEPYADCKHAAERTSIGAHHAWAAAEPRV